MIQGSHIYLTPMSDGFASTRARWMNSAWVSKNLNLPRPIDSASTRAWCAALANDPRRLDFIICLQTDSAPVGYIGFRDIDPHHRRAELYLGLGERRGLGHAREALDLALRHAFGPLGMHKVYAKIRTSNRLTLRLAQDFGARLDGILRDEVVANGRFHDIAILSLLASEFTQSS